MLFFALQRGSLRYLLEWIETALLCSKEVTISHLSFLQVLSQLDETLNCDCKKLLSIDIAALEDRISVNKIAVLLMKIVSLYLIFFCKNMNENNCTFMRKFVLFQIIKLSKNYANSWVNSDIPNVHTISAKRVQDNCEVYVWGSNSSHQLAEDVQEKIAVPKIAKNLINVEQVSVYNNNSYIKFA